MNKKNVRQLAFETLLKIEYEEAYSHLLIHHVINRGLLNEKDSRLFTEIVYGTVQRKNTLDYYISHFVTRKIKRKDEWVIPLLRMALYQMIYLEKIPAHAVVFETVQIAKRKGHQGIASLVNGVLRNVQRQGLPQIDEIRDTIKRFSVKYSHPEWLVSEWIDQYGIETAEKICQTNLKRPQVTARVNIRKTSRSDIVLQLESEGVIAEKSHLSVDGVVIQAGNLVQTEAFKQGLVTIQDESSMLVGRAVNPQKGETILDCCAAPGGKTTHLAELMNCEGEIVALDIHEHKLNLIQQQVERLQLSNITLHRLDARKARSKFSDESFDRILVDAPCTGFGVIRRKPDIKWKKTENDVAEMRRIQLDILEAVAPLLKKGGTLVYSTCTIERRENEQVIETFLNKHPQFFRDEHLPERLPKKLSPYMKNRQGELQILPHYFSSDGFFIAALRKK